MVGIKRLMVLGAMVLAILMVISGCGTKTTPPSTTQGQTETKTETKAETKEPYKIGAVFDSSGPASSLGIPERDTALMIVEQINAAGGIDGHPIDLKIYDNKSDATESVLVANKLIKQDQVLAIVGAATSGTTLAMLDTVQKAEIPLVSSAASVKIIEPVADRKWVFKTAQSDPLVAGAIINYLKSKGLSKIAFMSMNNAFGDSGKVEFAKAAAEGGITIVAEEKFEETDKDMTAQLTRIKGFNPQAVLVWAIPPSASILTKNYRQLGITVPLIQSHGVGNQTFIDLAGADANGVVFPIGKLLVAEGLPDSDPQKAVLVKYAKDYEANFGPRSTFGGHAWDALNLVIEAIKKVGPDSAKIRDEIENTKNFIGISGVFNMSTTDHMGLTSESLGMVEIVDGKWQPIK